MRSCRPARVLLYIGIILTELAIALSEQPVIG